MNIALRGFNLIVPSHFNTYIIGNFAKPIDSLIAKCYQEGGRTLYNKYQVAQTETFLDKIYEGNAKELISTLIQKDLISADEYEDLIKHWKGGGKKE